MPLLSIVWDLDDDPDCNVQHYLEHGVTKQEVADVLQGPTDTGGSAEKVPGTVS